MIKLIETVTNAIDSKIKLNWVSILKTQII